MIPLKIEEKILSELIYVRLQLLIKQALINSDLLKLWQMHPMNNFLQ